MNTKTRVGHDVARKLPTTFVMVVLASMLGAATAVHAQAKDKADRLMTRDELRACMKRGDDMKGANDDLEGARKALDVEKADLAKARDVLDQQVKAVAAERDAVDKANEAAVKAYNDKVAAMIATYNTKKAENDTKADAWNARNRAQNDRAIAHEQALKSYNDDCATRRYREDDEKAIRAGK